MPGTVGIVISVGVGSAVFGVVLAVFLVKCYLNWKRQSRTKRLQTASADGTVQQLVLSSQPVDFIPLLIQDQLEEEDDEVENPSFPYISGTSSEDLNFSPQKGSKSDVKGKRFPPPLQRVDTASSILDKYNRKLKKPRETGTRGESMFFDDTEATEESTAKKKTTLAGSPFPQRSLSANQRPGAESTKASASRGRIRSDSTKSLSRESLINEGPDPTPHLRSSVVSSVDTKAPRSKLSRPRKNSTSEISPTGKASRKLSRIPEKRGNVIFRVNYFKDKHALEVHLVNATGLPIRHGNLLDSFARISLKTPSKHQRHQSKMIKKTCNPIFDEKFLFDSVYFSELQQAHLKIKLMNRVGAPRCEPIGEVAVALCDEDILRGSSVCRELFERAGKSQCAGELLVSVCHQATSSHLKVSIMKLKDLPKSIKSPSVTVELTHKNEILQQHQVKTKKKTLTLNEDFSFEVATNSSCTLENFGVQFTVYQHDFMRGNEIVGQVRLAMDAPLQTEVMHWTAVVLSPHKPIAEWHKLHAPLQ